MLLHGLAGQATEWRDTARWLSRSYRVLALDQRGHGLSSKACADYSRDVYVADAISVIERLTAGPIILIGQSMGGLNAFLTAARRPDLVRALIVVEASPSPAPSAADTVGKWLDSWPVPFPTIEDARRFFGGDTLYARTWAEVLEEHEDGFWPSFRRADMVASLQDVATTVYWSEWDQISCPTLVVGGQQGTVPLEQMETMVTRIRYGRFIQISEAGHDLHLEQPERWREAVEGFLPRADAR